VTALLFVLAVGSQHGDALPTLTEIQERLDSLEVAQGELRSREVSLSEQLLAAERALDVCRSQLEALQGLRERGEQELQAVADSLGRLQVETELHRTGFGRALREVYLLRGVPPLGMVLSARSFGQAARRGCYLWLVISRRRELLDRSIELGARIAAARDELEEGLGRLDILYEEEGRRLAQLSRHRSEREGLLRTVTARKEEYSALMQELEHQKADLERVLEAMPATPAEVEMASLRGELGWPVQGPVVGAYGMRKDRRHWTKTFNPGVDIQAEEGEMVAAVAPGVVVYSGWHSGLGNLVVLDHGAGYYTLYGHLLRPRVAVGQHVLARQRIGDVGDTLSLRGPCLHFQIRHQRRSLDPLQWLSGGEGS
jgi:septal ring factor EnvC (AmiA/AmiB activator)